MKFAARTEFDGAETAYGRALREVRTAGGLLDLTISNPTRCNFLYPADRLLSPLGDPRALQYDADPLGMLSAREAISKIYREVYAADIHPGRLLLTASTSEACSYLLRLFCEPGDAILVPSPSYPLFDLLARLHDVELVPYPLVYHDGWQIDPASLGAAVTPRTRALVAIHPNNPTGHYCSEADRGVLHAIALKHDLPLIVDEVFLDYRLETNEADDPGYPTFVRPRWDQPFAVAGDQPDVLTFVLGGLSKLLALPQMKLAWTAVCGPAAQAEAAMQRLEVIADTFLSVATPPQVALPAWLGERIGIQQQIVSRVLRNQSLLDLLLHGSVISRLRVEGGWTAVVRVPALEADTELAVRLLREHRLAVHPGSLYGFPESGWLVISLLPESEHFEAAVRRLLAAIHP